MYCIALKYTVSSEFEKFELEYGRNGSWFKLLEACDDYLGHDLMKSEDGTTYLVTFKWISKEAFEDFKAANQSDYEALQGQLASLHTDETSLGGFHILQ